MDYLNQATQSIQSAKDSVAQNMEQFSSPANVEGNSDFVNSNGSFAKYGFIFVILIGFVVAFKFGVMVLGFIFQRSGSPYLVKGMLSGSDPQTIQQDSTLSDSVVVMRSANQTSGIEFTWSVWLNINSANSKPLAQHIFNKGSATVDQTNGTMKPNNAPGLYLTGTDDPSSPSNTLAFLMDTIDPNQGVNWSPEPIVIGIENVPIGKWFNLIIRLQNKVLDVYVNGTVVKRTTFLSTPKQNYDNVNISQNGGFAGSLSNLRYFDRALSVFQINSIVNYGPNTNSSSLSNKYNSNYDYLSSAWYRSAWGG